MIYALCRILVKCRDLRIFPGKKFRIPGTKNYYAALPVEPIENYIDWMDESHVRAKVCGMGVFFVNRLVDQLISCSTFVAWMLFARLGGYLS